LWNGWDLVRGQGGRKPLAGREIKNGMVLERLAKLSDKVLTGVIARAGKYFSAESIVLSVFGRYFDNTDLMPAAIFRF